MRKRRSFLLHLIFLTTSSLYCMASPIEVEELCKETKEFFSHEMEKLDQMTGNYEDKESVIRCLDQMVLIDQTLRTKHGLIPYALQESAEEREIWSLVEQIDQRSSREVAKMMEVHTWFPISEFGEEASRKAWLLVQHSTDTNLQYKVLFLLDYFSRIGEVSLKNYAYLYDRLTLQFSAIKQLYGTQFVGKENSEAYYLAPYLGSLEEVEERRRELGMSSLAEYAKVMEEGYRRKVILDSAD